MKNTKEIVTIYHWYPKNLLTLVVNILALMVSYYFNKSFLWACFHFLFGWIYMIYSLLLGRFAGGKFVEIITSYF